MNWLKQAGQYLITLALAVVTITQVLEVRRLRKENTEFKEHITKIFKDERRAHELALNISQATRVDLVLRIDSLNSAHEATIRALTLNHSRALKQIEKRYKDKTSVELAQLMIERAHGIRRGPD